MNNSKSNYYIRRMISFFFFESVMVHVQSTIAIFFLNANAYSALHR